MKKKKNIKVLLPIVLIIWGIVGYQVFSILGSDGKGEALANTSVTFRKPIIKEKDTFSLIPLTRDPFLGTAYRPKKQQPSRKKTVRKVEIPWPSVAYKGLVSDQLDVSKVFILAINGREYLLRTGDTVQQIKVLNGGASRIELRFKNKNKVFELK